MMLVLLSSFIGSFGAVLLKSGSATVTRNLESLLLNRRLAAGVFLFLLSSIFFVKGIRVGELTVLYPISSLGYLWTVLWSNLFFGEAFTKTKFLGLGLILLGVFCVGMGGR